MRNRRARAVKTREQNKWLIQTIEVLSSSSKVLNGVYLSQLWANGTIDYQKVSQEFLGLQRDLTLEAIKKANVGEVDTILDDISTKVRDGCSGDDKACEGWDVAAGGVDKLVEARDKLITINGDIVKDGSVLNSFHKLIVAFQGMKTAKENAANLVKSLQTTAAIDDDEKESIGGGINYWLDKLKRFPNAFMTSLTPQNIKMLTQVNFETEVAKVSGLKSLGDALKDKSLQLLKGKLARLIKLGQELKPYLSDNNFQKMDNKMKVLVSINNSPKLKISEKSLTPAFYSGAADLEKLFSDVELLFERSLIDSTSKENLKELFSTLSTLNKEIQPLYNSLQNRQNMIGVSEKIVNGLKSAKAEVESIEKLEPLKQCVDDVFGVEANVDTDKWGKEKGHASEIGNHAVDFGQQYVKSPIQLPVLMKLSTEVAGETMKVLYDKVINYQQKDDMIKELEALIKRLDELGKMEISKWIDVTKLDTLVPELEKWVKSPELSSSLKCLQNQAMIDAGKQELATRITYSALLKLTSDDQYRRDVKKASDNLKMVVSEWEKFENSLKNRKKRAAERVPMLEKAGNISRDFSVGLKAYRDLIAAYASGNDIQQLLSLEKSIDGAIKKLTDQTKKDNMNKLWNQQTKDTLKKLPTVVDTMNLKIQRSPKKIDEYAEIFKNPKGFEEMKDVDMAALIDNIQAMDMSLLDPRLAERLRPLEMDFASGNSNSALGLNAFTSSIPWFSKLQSSSRIGDDSVQDGSTGGEYGLGWVVVAGGAGLLLGFCLAFLWTLCCGVCEHWEEKEGGKMKAWKKSKNAFYAINIRKKKAKRTSKASDGQDTTAKSQTLPTTPGEGKNGTGTEEIPKPEKPKTMEKQLKKTAVFKKKDGGFYVRPASNALNTPDDDEKIVENPTQDEADIELVDYEKNAPKDVVEKIKKLVETSEKFSKDQRIIRHKYQKEENDNPFKFQRMTVDEFRAIHARKYENTPLIENARPVFKSEKIKYVVGVVIDIFIDADEPEESIAQKTADALQASEKVPKRKREKTVEDEELEKELSEKKEDITQASERVLSQKNAYFSETRASAGTDEPVISGELTIKKDITSFFVKSLDDWIKAREEKLKGIIWSESCAIYTDSYFRENQEPPNQPFDTARLLHLMHTEEIILNAKRVNDSKDLSQKMLSFNKCLEIVKAAKGKFSDEPALLAINRKKLRAVGDIHGGFADMARHLELGIREKESSFLFLGDYVDRGTRNVDVVLQMCLLKIACPTRYFFLRGNHEMSGVNSRSGFLKECCETFGKKDGKQFWKLANEMFEELPIAAIVNNKVWCSHGGISGLMLKGREYIEATLKKKPESPEEWKLFIDVLWSDPDAVFPSSSDINSLFPAFTAKEPRTVYASKFSPLGLQRVLDVCGFEFIVRGHQVKEFGFEQFYSFKCITTFGATNNHEQNWACHMIINEDLSVEFIQMESKDLQIGKDEVTVADDKNQSSSKPNKPKPKAVADPGVKV